MGALPCFEIKARNDHGAIAFASKITGGFSSSGIDGRKKSRIRRAIQKYGNSGAVVTALLQAKIESTFDIVRKFGIWANVIGEGVIDSDLVGGAICSGDSQRAVEVIIQFISGGVDDHEAELIACFLV